MISEINSGAVYIDASDSNYLSLLSQLKTAIDRKRLVPFLGAGASRLKPSNLPLANELVMPLVNALWDSGQLVVGGERISQNASESAKTLLMNARLERLLDALNQTHGSTTFKYLEVLNSRAWNINHGALATLSQAGTLPWCVTLNFDLLIETALGSRGVASETICPIIGKSFQTGLGNVRTKILKPHGSFAPDWANSDPYTYLSATISQAGVKPHAANILALREAFTHCPVLLIGGYSDNDWDIFPILSRLKNQFEKVIWVQHIDGGKVSSRPPTDWEIYSKIRELGKDTVLLIGPLDQLLCDLTGESESPQLDMNGSPADSAPSTKTLATRLFSDSDGKNDPRSIKTAISLSRLLQNTGEFNDRLLACLHKHPLVVGNPEFSWQVEHILSHSEHTRGRVHIAVRHMTKSIKLKQMCGVVNKTGVASDKLWLGYEYLCQAKRPNLARPATIFLMPYYMLRGSILMKEAVGMAPFDEQNKLRSLEMFYRADFLHSWLNLTMLFGPKPAFIFRIGFKIVAKKYDDIAKNSLLMEDDYYWLRHLEAKLLARRRLDENEIKRQLGELEEMNKLIQRNVQIGNTFAYRALYESLINGQSQIAEGLLEEAEKRWGGVESEISAGRKRLVLFRRFLLPKTLSLQRAFLEIVTQK